MTTVNRMKLITQKNDTHLNTVVPSELKNLVAEFAAKDNVNVSQWVKMALIEKLERDTPNQ